MSKRFFDIIFALVGLVVLFPLFIFAMVLIKFNSPGPIFFKQKRIGRSFKEFNLYKFRSMVSDVISEGSYITASGDLRITKSGKLLRKLKFDELPQFINVLVGDMSFVGPRPEVPKYVELFRNDYNEILMVRPGITDYASILYHDEESILARYDNYEDGYIREILPAKILLNKKYIRERNLCTDVFIIMKTISVIIR